MTGCSLLNQPSSAAETPQALQQMLLRRDLRSLVQYPYGELL
jgi:hypothetical protein